MNLWYVLVSITLARVCALFLEHDRLTIDARGDMKLLWTLNLCAAAIFAAMFLNRLYQKFRRDRPRE